MVDIIFLNGTSSSGKSSIAKKIQEISNIPFIHLEIDTFLQMIKFEHIDCDALDGVNETCAKLISGFHKCFGSMVNAGNHVIIDHVLQEKNWLPECLAILKQHKVYLVGVHCNIDSLNERESKRGDRPIGLAESQLGKVHYHEIYDIEVNTDLQTSEECARQIINFLMTTENPKAWSQLISRNNIT